MTTSPLVQWSRNDFSQRGEDGIIERILSLIGPGSRWCVEFGAWDGIHLSNTHTLMKKGWSGVFIEGDPVKFKDLERVYRDNSRAFPLCAMVGWVEPEDLDSLLSQTPIPSDFSVLSIDIDGNDYHVWEALKRFQPRLVVIEFNPSIPPHIEYIQPKSALLNKGNSLKSLALLGGQKGYDLVATTSLNAFFVRRDLSKLVGVSDHSVEALFMDRSHITDVFQLYDGTLVFSGNTRLLWHEMNLRIAQPVPSYFRQFPTNMGKVKRMLYKIWRKVNTALFMPL